MFPKTDAITVDDKEVEFIMKTQRFEVKRKFKLKTWFSTANCRFRRCSGDSQPIFAI